jgi:putative transcriptional regulator
MNKSVGRKKLGEPTISERAPSRHRLKAVDLRAVSERAIEVSTVQTKRDGASKKRKKPKQQVLSGGAKIVAALEEAIEAMRAGQPLNVRTYHFAFPLRDYGPDDVRRVRSLFRMSQTVFAEFLGVDANTIQSWEQEARPVSHLARRFLTEIEAHPEYWRQRIAQCIEAVPSVLTLKTRDGS